MGDSKGSFPETRSEYFVTIMTTINPKPMCSPVLPTFIERKAQIHEQI